MLCLWTWQSAPMAHHTTATEAVDLRTKKDRQVHTARPTAPEAVDALTDTLSGRRQPPAAGGQRFIATTAWKLRVGSVSRTCGAFQSSRQPQNPKGAG